MAQPLFARAGCGGRAAAAGFARLGIAREEWRAGGGMQLILPEPHEARVNQGRADGVDPYVVRRQILGCCQRHANQRRLGSHVCGHRRGPADGRNAGGGDDGPAPRVPHGAADGLQYVETADHVDVHHLRRVRARDSGAPAIGHGGRSHVRRMEALLALLMRCGGWVDGLQDLQSARPPF
eukprot:scaffold18130_cov119-Isochrysis_galbana.AAC.3